MARVYTEGDLRALILRCNSKYWSYLLTRNFDDLQEAIRCAQEGFFTTPSDGPPRPFFEWILGKSFARRFLHTRQREDITKAIGMSLSALKQMTPAHPQRQTCVNYLIFSFLLQDNELEGSVHLDDLHLRISKFRCLSSVTISFDSGEAVEVCQNFLTDVDDFRVRNSSTSAVKIKIETLSPKLGDDDEVFSYFYTISLGIRLPNEASLDELDSEILLLRQALKAFSTPPADSRKIWKILCELGSLLWRRYLTQSVLEENDEAITCFTLALDLDVQIRPEMVADCHYFLSQALLIRHIASGNREDLDNAIEYAKQATASSDSQTNITFAGRLGNLAKCMGRRHLVTGELKDLNVAIETGLRAVNAAERDGIHSYLPVVSRDLAASLSLRSEQTGQFKEKKHAIEIRQRAVDSMSLDNPRRVLHLWNLGSYEMSLGESQGDTSYLERGLRHLNEAMSTVTDDFEKHYKRDPSLYYELQLNRGNMLHDKGVYREALKIARMLAREFPHMPHARKISHLLCDTLLGLWKQTHDKGFLDEAISAAHHSLKLESRVNGLISARTSLGMCYYHRYNNTGNPEDLKNALEVLLAGFHMCTGAAITRITPGQMAIEILCGVPDWDQARDLSGQMTDLIAIESSRSLDCTDKQDWLPSKLYQVPTYASIALQAGSDVLDVVDMLETCRGSILGHMLDYRTDLHELMQVAPGKAERFAALRDETNSEISLSGNMNVRVEQMSRRSAAEAELRACLEDIRKLEGFDRFLLGPSRSDIKAAAAHGPILIIKVTTIRSDAIIITENGGVLLPLPELKYEKVLELQRVGSVDCDIKRMAKNNNEYLKLLKWLWEDSDIQCMAKNNKEYLKLLKWLWDNCVKLIFQKLDDLVRIPATEKLHVWWMGIGIASPLPFHAAGIYTGKVRDSALFRATSSYIPTLKFLIHGRRKLKDLSKSPSSKPETQLLPSKPEMLIVTMPSTPGMSKLTGVIDEAEIVQKIVGASYSLQHSIQPTAKETMERMEKCQVVHFACHGQSVLRHPLSSHLLLQTAHPHSPEPVVDELTVRDVTTLNLDRGVLAFLSACSTAQNRNEELWDEGLHLASGFLVAGYLHTVGNLWPAEDGVSVQIVKGFYQHLLESGQLGTGQNVARALNEALVDIVREKGRQPLTWAQFVHCGV